MAGWKGVYTQKGLALLAKMTPSGTLNITRAVVGAGLVNEADLSKQTKVTDIKQELAIQPPTYPERGTCKLPVVLANDKVGSAYTARQIGFYATDPTEGEILYFIAQSSTGTSILPENEIAGYTATWTFYFSYGEADSVTVKVDPSNAVTKEMLEEVRVIAERGVSDQGYGEVIVMNDTANLPFAGLSIYGKSVQEGIPTPDVPVDIVNVGANGNIAVNVYGKNLFAVTEYTQNGVTLSQYKDFYVLNGTATASCNFITTIGYLPAGTYTLSANNPTNSNVDFGIVDVHSGSLGETLQVRDAENYGQITGVLSGAADYACRVRVENGVTYNNYIIKPQLEYGGEATEYQARTKQTTTLSAPDGLRGLPVTSGGNYTDTTGQQWICDEIDLVRGVYIQRIGAVDLSSLTWSSAVNWQQAVVEGMQYVAANTEVGVAMAENYSIRMASGMTTSAVGEMAVDTNNIKINTGSASTTPSGLLIYQLTEPIESEIDIDALYCQNPATTIINNSGAEMFVDCIRSNNENAFRLAANSKHTHEIAGVNGLQAALDAK